MFNLIKNSVLVVLIFSIMVILACQTENDKKRKEEKYKSLTLKIGEKFTFYNFIDSSGIITRVEFSKSEFTIVDFWFSTCPPCIEEMKMFEKVLAGKEITIMSVSINSYQEWKKSFDDTSPRFKFLQRKVSNWNHYVMISEENPKLNNSIPLDVQQKLLKELGVTFYPAYFVVDKNGNIIERPVSAVAYIQKL